MVGLRTLPKDAERGYEIIKLYQSYKYQDYGAYPDAAMPRRVAGARLRRVMFAAAQKEIPLISGLGTRRERRVLQGCASWPEAVPIPIRAQGPVGGYSHLLILPR